MLSSAGSCQVLAEMNAYLLKSQDLESMPLVDDLWAIVLLVRELISSCTDPLRDTISIR